MDPHMSLVVGVPPRAEALPVPEALPVIVPVLPGADIPGTVVPVRPLGAVPPPAEPSARRVSLNQQFGHRNLVSA